MPISLPHLAEHHSGAPAGEEQIHLPSPTLAPATVGLGVMILTFGILYGVVLVVIGALFMVLGIAVWLINDAREFVKAGDQGGHH